MDSIAKKSSIRALREALNSLRTSLPEVYSDAMARIETQDAEDAMLARKNQYVGCFHEETLRFDDLQHALALEPGDTSVDPDTFLDENLIVEICAGLVAVDHNTASDALRLFGCRLISRNQASVRLVHYTAQAFFDDIRARDFPESSTCIKNVLNLFAIR